MISRHIFQLKIWFILTIFLIFFKENCQRDKGHDKEFILTPIFRVLIIGDGYLYESYYLLFLFRANDFSTWLKLVSEQGIDFYGI